MGDVVNLFSRSQTTKVSTVESRSLVAKSAQEIGEQAKGNGSVPKIAATDFDSIAKRNALIQEKMRQERAQANKLVLKSYRIK